MRTLVIANFITLLPVIPLSPYAWGIWAGLHVALWWAAGR